MYRRVLAAVIYTHRPVVLPEPARKLYDFFYAKMGEGYTPDRVKNGVFQAMMESAHDQWRRGKGIGSQDVPPRPRCSNLHPPARRSSVQRPSSF
jgi:hypothetical protein